MAVDFDSTADVIGASSGGAIAGNVEARTICGLGRIEANAGSGTQLIAAFSDSASYFSAALEWRSIAGDTMSLRADTTGAVANRTNFASRPAVGELFFWYLKCSGTGAGQVEGGWGYLDGSAMVTATTALESGTDGAVALLILGGVISAHLRGQLGALRQWTAALSAAELENERYQIYASRRDNLIGEYPLWDVATSLTDFSGNGATLTNLSGFGGTAPSDTAVAFPVRIRARRAGRGVAVAPITVATLSAPTATSVTATTATIGATTDQTSGTFYAVVDSAANLAGVTATQIKAGQKASGSAALAANNAAVSTTTPSVGVTGLSATTLYSFAAVQNNANGDSNVVTGTFTTLDPPITQSRYRWRNDDGSESSATWAAAENAALTAPTLTPRRLRVQLDATGDPASKRFKLQYRKVGDGTWRDIN